MQKKILIYFLILTVCGFIDSFGNWSNTVCRAESDVDAETFNTFGTNDINSLIKNYEDAKFEKIVSDKQYQQAIKTKEEFLQKNSKNKKNINSSNNSKKTGIVSRLFGLGKSPKNQADFTQNHDKDQPVVFEMPDSPNPLLALNYNIAYENIIIPQGFYLVNLRNDTGTERYFLELRQGTKNPIVSIEMQGHTVPVNQALKPSVSVENIDEQNIKITYSFDNLVLESVLQKL